MANQPYQHVQVPADGESIQLKSDNILEVPDNPIIPFVEGEIFEFHLILSFYGFPNSADASPLFQCPSRLFWQRCPWASLVHPYHIHAQQMIQFFDLIGSDVF